MWQSDLELELRLQQFIELSRSGEIDKLMDAIVHARKHLAGDQSSKFGLRAGGLMAYPPDTFVEPYQVRRAPLARKAIQLTINFSRLCIRQRDTSICRISSSKPTTTCSPFHQCLFSTLPYLRASVH